MMKTFLIAAGLMAAIGAAPASAAPVAGNVPAMAAPAPQHEARGERHDDRRWDRRHDRRWERRHNRRSWHGRRCHSERRHGRWVRICRRR